MRLLRLLRLLRLARLLHPLRPLRLAAPLAATGLLLLPAAGEGAWVALFPQDGVPPGWLVREWHDVSLAAGEGTQWTVEGGVLKPGSRRGTWLLSPRTYGDFELEVEVRLTEFGNSGIALRAPLRGDPAFDGLELQVADLRYNPAATPAELTGGLYRALAPGRQLYRPVEWNRVRVELRGSRLKAVLNGVTIHDTDLARHTTPVRRHDGTEAPPLRDRPRRGHVGFQHLSRENAPVLIRGARIREL